MVVVRLLSYVSLQPHRLQLARLPCPSLSLGVCSNSCPLSQWCYLTISSSAAPFFFCLQSFPASGSFPVRRLFVVRWPKYWSFSFSPSNKYSALISFIRTLVFFFFWYILVCLEQCFTHFRSVCWIFKRMNEWMHVMNTRRRKWCIGHTRKRQGWDLELMPINFKLCLNVIQKNNT